MREEDLDGEDFDYRISFIKANNGHLIFDFDVNEETDENAKSIGNLIAALHAGILETSHLQALLGDEMLSKSFINKVINAFYEKLQSHYDRPVIMPTEVFRIRERVLGNE